MSPDRSAELAVTERSGDRLRVLALEAYYGGSHAAFLDAWIRQSRHDWTVHTLPASKWKWRMRQSPFEFARGVGEQVRAGRSWDIVFTSDMTQLAEFRGLVDRSVAELSTVLYFHENQITYPVRFASSRDYHFGLSNLSSALAADQIWFNSEYHRRELLAAVPAFLRKMPDNRPPDVAAAIESRSCVESPAIHCVDAVAVPPVPSSELLRILWVARWEFDKGPEIFFEALERLAQCGVEFEVSVLGESFERVPETFATARASLGERVVDWGYLDGRGEFEAALRAADVVVSTARHEFFGLAILEAVSAGAYPLVPRRLSYPELFAATESGDPFYDGGASQIAARLEGLAQRKRSGESLRGRFVDTAKKHDWSLRAPQLDEALSRVLASCDTA